MKLKDKWKDTYEAIDQKYLEQFGFRLKETSFLKLVKYLHEPKDSSSLAVTRILFGLAMLFDIPDERGGAVMDYRWGGKKCHFPLLPFVTALPMPYIAAVYTALWLGALGLMLGYKFRASIAMFTICYWYLFLIEKSYWNNHSYLFGLVAFLLSFTQAGGFWSIDAYLDPAKEKKTVPYWNYFLLKYQFFILYFMAGLKKGTAEWLTGYSVQKLSEHWVFDPFKFFLTVSQIDYLIVHWFIFVFDLTVAIWMMWGRTRHVAMVFCAIFHLMNSRLFRIGMFPWVCLATMPLYYPFDWPKIVRNCIEQKYLKIKSIICSYLNTFNSCAKCRCKTKEEVDGKDESDEGGNFVTPNIQKEDRKGEKYTDDGINISGGNNYDDNNIEISEFTKDVDQESNRVKETCTVKENTVLNKSNTLQNEVKYESVHFQNIDRREKLNTYLIIFYVFLQAFLPFSHFITKGYNNWTDGLYGYSWDMMVHTWDTQSVIIKIVDNENNQEYFIDPSVYAPNDRWTRHGDMVHQYAKCLYHKLLKEMAQISEPDISKNMSIYVDVWCSMNGRFTQRLFDPKVDILAAPWSPFQKVSYLMPLLDEAIHWRSTLNEITEEVHSWDNKSDVIYFADFSDYEQEKYIPPELSNVSLTVLEGVIVVEPEPLPSRTGQSYKLTDGNTIVINSGLFHKVLNIGTSPAYYMYTYKNNTQMDGLDRKVKQKLPILMELYVRFKGMIRFAGSMGESLVQMLFGCNGQC